MSVATAKVKLSTKGKLMFVKIETRDEIVAEVIAEIDAGLTRKLTELDKMIIDLAIYKAISKLENK